MNDAFDDERLGALTTSVDRWLAELAEEYDHIVAVDRTDEHQPGAGTKWYVRMRGEDKDFTTVWLRLGQRTLRYETYVMPAPEENAGELYEHVLRRNDDLVGAHFSIGLEDAIFLRGEIALGQLSRDELDRVLGTLYAQVERCFQGLLRIGFRSRF